MTRTLVEQEPFDCKNTMPASEFELIDRYFRRQSSHRDDVILGIGDDAALLQPPAGSQLVVAVDTLVAGRHFPEKTAAEDIGYKALAVNLSDLAAMGATPAWATLSLTLPAADDDWLKGFASGFYALADEHRVALVGGDTTRGPLAVSVQVQGFVAPGRALRRDGARSGDSIYVSGAPGEAACALQQVLAGVVPTASLLERLNRPTPRVALGQALVGIASAAIDVSDGLLADLGHMLRASHCGAQLWPERLPAPHTDAEVSDRQWRACQLNGGDDYELCFTVAAERKAAIDVLCRQQPVPLWEIGRVEAGGDLRCVYNDGRSEVPAVEGYDHFGGDIP